jgi:hypothetical protein
LLHLRQQVVGLGPVFEFVVIAEVDSRSPFASGRQRLTSRQPLSGVDGGPPLVPQA